MGTNKEHAMKFAQQQANSLRENVAVIHDNDYVEIYGENLSYYTVREKYIDGDEGPAFDIIAMLEPRPC